MTAKTSSINGVTRLRQFHIDIRTFERKGGIMVASAEASTLGLRPGEWPDNFRVEPIGTFVLRQVLKDGSREYNSADGNCRFTIWND